MLPVLCCLVACEPESIEPKLNEPKPNDYRLEYVGDYAYTIDYWDYHVGRYPGPLSWDTTWYYSGTISLVDDSLKNRILVNLLELSKGHFPVSIVGVRVLVY